MVSRAGSRGVEHAQRVRFHVNVCAFFFSLHAAVAGLRSVSENIAFDGWRSGGAIEGSFRETRSACAQQHLLLLLLLRYPAEAFIYEWQKFIDSLLHNNAQFS